MSRERQSADPERIALDDWKRKRDWEESFLERPLPGTPGHLLNECQRWRRELADITKTTTLTVSRAPQVVERLWKAMRAIGGSPPPRPRLTECTEAAAQADMLTGRERFEALHQAIDAVACWCTGGGWADATPVGAGTVRNRGRGQSEGDEADNDQGRPGHSEIDALLEEEEAASKKEETRDRLQAEEYCCKRHCEDSLDALSGAINAMREEVGYARQVREPADISRHLPGVAERLKDTLDAFVTAGYAAKWHEIDQEKTRSRYYRPDADGDQDRARRAHRGACLLIEQGFQGKGKETLRNMVEAIGRAPKLTQVWKWLLILLKGLFGQQQLDFKGTNDVAAEVQATSEKAEGTGRRGAPLTPGAPEGAGAPRDGGGAGQGQGTVKRKGKTGKPPMEESNPLKFQVYERIQREHRPGSEHVDTLNRLRADRQFTDQVRDAKLKLDKGLIRAALAFFDQRKRDQARKIQETGPG